MMELLGSEISHGIIAALLFTGFLAGAVNAVVGSGTLITFPVLVLLGFPPLVANITSNLGIIPGSIFGAFEYRSMLLANRARLARMLPLTVVGALIGSITLLALPGEVFAAVVPALIIAAILAVVAQPALKRWLDSRPHHSDRGEADKLSLALIIGLPLLGVYGGYFGAAQSVLLLVLLALAFDREFREVNGYKNLLAAAANIVSALMFLAVAPQHIDWLAAGIMAIGAGLGGVVGGRFSKYIPQFAYRSILVVVSFGVLIVFMRG